ncbi:MAG: hypothetical protein IPK04_14990 [Bdellovibrionales bacterium]|nr:hypothetical protein [Bdellovibrionales bacterium]
MKNILLTKLIFLISLGSFAASADITQEKLSGHINAARLQSSLCKVSSMTFRDKLYENPEIFSTDPDLKNHSAWMLSPLIDSVKSEVRNNAHVLIFAGKGLDAASPLNSNVQDRYLYRKLYTNFDFFNSFEIEVYSNESETKVTSMTVKTYQVNAVSTGDTLNPSFSNLSQQRMTINYNCN